MLPNPLEIELSRLREGRFTPEEFQNLCHNKDVQDGFDAFVSGCRDYQQKLFGRSATVLIDDGEHWPLKDVLRKLVEWSEHLLNNHNCDCHGYEELQAAISAGKKYLEQLGVPHG